MMKHCLLFLLCLVIVVTTNIAPAWTQRMTARRTPMTWKEAHEQILAQGVSKNVARLLTAQWALETQDGKKMWRYNYAGLKGASPRGFYCVLNTSEVKKGKKVKVQARFRAYVSPEAGARDFVHVMRVRFPCAFDAAEALNIKGYARCLREQRYYTSSAVLYERGLKRSLDENSENF